MISEFDSLVEHLRGSKSFKCFSWKCFGSNSNICKTVMSLLSGGINKCNERVSPEGCTRPWETSRSDKVA